MWHLISDYIIVCNLKRSAKNGLISLLNRKQLEDLAVKYFGERDENGNIVEYKCPYSGKKYTNSKDLILEHIVPVASNGGTVLFNCIPTSKEINGPDEKGAKHLIHWWESSKYWDQDAPYRLEKIVNYILDGYELLFSEYTMEELEASYLDIELDENILDEEDEDINIRRDSELLKEQAKSNQIHSYLSFILDCVRTLEKYNIPTETIYERLRQLQDKNIFEDIDKYQLYQNVIQKLIISRIGDNNSSYLTYNININVKKIIDSINLDNEEDIYNELNSRLSNIEQLLKSNNLSTIEYFKSLRDIQDIDIIYKKENEISKEDIDIFLINIKLGIDTKIDIFIEMLSEEKYTGYEDGKVNKNNILSNQNKVPFKDYDSIDALNTSHFWNNNSSKIKERLNYLESNSKSDEEREKYKVARRKIEEYRFLTNLDERINKFIEMLSEEKYTGYEDGKVNENNVFGRKNKVPFKDYDSIDGLNTSNFWNNNSSKIKERLNYLESNSESDEEREKYKVARRKIKEYEFFTNLDQKINKFIEMLSEEKYTGYEDGKANKNNIFSQYNKIAFKGYENIDVLNTSKVWNHYSSKIKERLKHLELNSESDEEREKYRVAIRKIEEYEFLIDSDQKINKFIEMLSEEKYTGYEDGRINKNNIFGNRNKVPFKDYDSIDGLNTSHFWSNYSKECIIPLLFYNKSYDNVEKKYKESDKDYSTEEYDAARNAVLEYLSINDKTKYSNIEQYMDNLEQKEKKSNKVLKLINLRNDLKNALELLKIQESNLINENNKLRNDIEEVRSNSI